jgi:hypothetical protein
VVGQILGEIMQILQGPARNNSFLRPREWPGLIKDLGICQEISFLHVRGATLSRAETILQKIMEHRAQNKPEPNLEL